MASFALTKCHCHCQQYYHLQNVSCYKVLDSRQKSTRE